MSTSRISRAEEILKLAELAARNLQSPSDPDDPGGPAKRDAFASLVGKIAYLKKRASALWKPEFEAVLDKSHSMRVERIEATKSKELLRPLSFKCMACGRTEKNCQFKIDLAGHFDSSAWSRDATSITNEYGQFVEDYESVYSNEFEDTWSACNALPDVDKGVYIVGATCLRKAVLRYTLQTLMLELCYAAEREMEEECSKGNASSFKRDTFYTVTREKAEELLAKQSALELAIADEKRHVCFPPVDHSFWAIIDRVRDGVAAYDDRVLDRLLVDRAIASMKSAASGGKNYAESSSQESDGSDDYEEQSGEDCAEVEQCGEQPRRRRTPSGACAENGEPSPRTRSGGAATSRARAKRPRRAVVDDESDDDAQQKPSPPALGPRETQPSVSGIVGMNRAAGVLPSRRAALLALMNLQTRLFVRGENADAVVCTNAIQTIQELLERVEMLSHTPGI